MTAVQTAALRRYHVRFFAAMATYSLVLVLMIRAARGDLPMWSKMLLMLMPVVPIVVALSELLRFVRSLDELQRRVQFEAVCIAAVLTCMLTFAWGLLEIAGVPKMPVVLVLPLFCAIYGPAVGLTNWRYQ